MAFAAEQTKIVDAMRTEALAASTPTKITGYLQYAVHYYPSGTKQQEGSQLDQIVERHRASVVEDIIAHLRTTTDGDLGEDPQRWIADYGGD